MTRVVHCAAIAALALAASPRAQANQFVSERTSDWFRYEEPVTGTTVTSSIASTSGRWSLWRQFAGLGNRWIYTSATNDVLGVWVPATGRTQLLPSLSGPVGASRSVNLGSPNVGTFRVALVGGSLSTPAGLFTDVTRLDSTATGNGAVTSMWFARGIGVIQWTRRTASGPRTFSLEAASVNGVTYPLPPPPPPPPVVGPPATFRDFVSLEVAPGVFEGEALAVGDLNDDGLTDIAICWWDHPNAKLSVFHQSPGGALDPAVVYTLDGYQCDSIDVGDVTGDGRDDVVAGFGDGVQVLTQTAGGALAAQPKIACTAAYVRVGDIDGDRREDVLALGWGSNTWTPSGLSVLLQDAQGRLGAPVVTYVEYHGYNDLELGDVTGDGRTDVVVMSGQLYAGRDFAVLAQNASGGLDAPVYHDLPDQYDLARGVGVGDVTGDGRKDVVLSHGGNSPSARISVFAQDAAGRMSAPPTSYSSYDCPEPVEVADLNGDGRGDVATVNGGWNAISVWHQDGAGGLGTYTRVPQPYASHYNSHGFVIADVNSDGKLDLLTANYNYGLVINYGQ